MQMARANCICSVSICFASYLLNHCASIHSAGVVLVWFIVHALLRHIVGFAHLSSLHRQGAVLKG